MFETERLIMRGMEESDADSLKAALNTADYLRNASPGVLAPVSMDRVKNLTKSRTGSEPPVFAVCLKPECRDTEDAETNSAGLPYMIGVINFQVQKYSAKNRSCSLGFGLHQAKHRGKGYGTEMMRWALQYGFNELNLHRIELTSYSLNEAATALWRKCGFVEEGRSRETVFSNGKWYDTLYWGMLEDEWRASQDKNAISI